MADAGRILIMPKGDYNPSVSYEILDLVVHNNISWLAKKDSVGIEPSVNNSEYWFKLTEGGGDATTFDGRKANEFHRLGAVESLPSGVDLNTYTSLGQWGADTDSIAQSIINKPDAVTVKFRLKVEATTRNYNPLYVRQTIYLSNSAVTYERCSVNGVFKPWDTGFLPSNGGTVGKTTVKTDGAIPFGTENTGSDINVHRFVGKSGALGHLGFNGKNNPVFMKADGGYLALIHAENVGQHALPISGGTLATYLCITGGYGVLSGDANHTQIQSRVSITSEQGRRGFLVCNTNASPTVADALRLRDIKPDGTETDYAVLHTGNSAKVVVSQTPLTSAGSIRVW
jgi:hypothetical protein